VRRAFVDTWAWVALADRGDRDAVRISQELRAAGHVLITSSPVLYEAYTFLRRSGGLDAARRLREEILTLMAGNGLTVERVRPEDEQLAWERFEMYDTDRLSFVDCTSFAIMERLGLTEAFTGDQHFAMAGFTVLCPRSA
jgi:predicted nucleic acid-binding protein